MFVLELVNRDYEGIWTNNLCVSQSREKLLARMTVEKVKYIQKEGSPENVSYLFLIGELENFVFDKVQQARDSYNGEFYIVDKLVLKTYKEIKVYAEEKAMPLCTKLGLDNKILKKVIDSEMYESLRFTIKEIEEI